MKSIKSPLLSPYKNILHAYTTKEGGFSQEKFLGNNLAFHVNDNLDTVNKNHLYTSQYLDYPLENLIRMEQLHSDKITIIDKDFSFAHTPQCDALITDLKNIPLMVMVADCIPVLLYDPIKGVIASVHAGRAGIFSKILPKTIQEMQKKYNCHAEDILVSLGPSIHQCCYEVGAEINDEAENHGYSFALKIENERYHLDLLSIAYRQLEEIGIGKKSIEIIEYCTACNTDIFYSYRAEKNRCGRFAGIIMLR